MAKNLEEVKMAIKLEESKIKTIILEGKKYLKEDSS